DRERLAGAGGAQQGDMGVPGLHGLRQLVDRLRLVAGGLEVGHDAEGGHERSVGPVADTGGSVQVGTGRPLRKRFGLHDDATLGAGRGPAMSRTIVLVVLSFAASGLFAIPSASASAPSWP